MRRLLRCPNCLEPLQDAGPSLLACAGCGPYPVLQGVPVLVPDPAAWCGRFHDAILAAMAEEGDVAHHEVLLVQRFAAQAGRSNEPFGDDWTGHELLDAPPPRPARGRARASMQRLLEEPGPGGWIEKRLPRARVALEVGCGAAIRTRALAARSELVIAADLSLRAVLRSRVDDHVHGVVLDAQALPFASKCADVVVAENVIDLLDAPHDFLTSMRRVVRAGGRAFVSTPDPALGGDDEATVDALLREAKWKTAEVARGLTWTRVNSARFVEVYFADAWSLQPG